MTIFSRYADKKVVTAIDNVPLKSALTIDKIMNLMMKMAERGAHRRKLNI